MLDAVVLPLVDGARIVVPNSLDLITPFVLCEQRDFFEDELPFVRRLLHTGQKVIDIGANYGVYTLSMAQKVGPSGHVWAFEPTASTAKFLLQSIALNGFKHVTVEQTAVSSAPGTAQLTLNSQSELNSIVHGAGPQNDTQAVSLVTLDDCMDEYSWKEIELIKMDAEGEEINIVKGGRRFFARFAPLVQYELRIAADMNLELIREFASLGYNSYRLVPGLNVLVPFDIESTPDPYLLNLYGCDSWRADRLAARGLLLRFVDLAEPNGPEAGTNSHWGRALAHLTYAAPLVREWSRAEEAEENTDLYRALSLYARSRDESLSLAMRFRHLKSAFNRFKEVCERNPSPLRLASLARVASDIGERAVAVNALNQLVEAIKGAGTVNPNEPFLAPLERFDAIAPGESFGKWLLAAALEHLELRERFSSFYAGPGALTRLEAIHDLEFGSPEMERRLDLIRLLVAHHKAKSPGATQIPEKYRSP